MSYERYSQFLCKKGHYWTEDAYTVDTYGVKKCPECKLISVWENMVDITNCSFDDDGTRIDGYIDLKVKKVRQGNCSACKKPHICETTYKIPKTKSTRNIKKLAQLILVFMTGSLFGNLVWHFRLKKPILLRELLLDLQSGGTPFLDWFYLLSFLVMLGWGIYIIGFMLIEWRKQDYTK